MVLSKFEKTLSALCCGVLSACAAAPTQPAAPLASRGTMGVALVHDHNRGRPSSGWPPEAEAEIKEMLTARGFTLKVLSVDDAAFAGLKNAPRTQARLRALRQADAQVPWLLVEAYARYGANVYTRYRWNVALKASYLGSAAEAESKTARTDVPTFLRFRHQREEDALDMARKPAVQLVRELLDDQASVSQVVPVNGPVFFAMLDRYGFATPRPDTKKKTP